VDERRRAARILLQTGFALTAALLFFNWADKGWWRWVHGLAIPLVPFLCLSAAASSPRFPRSYLYGLAAFFIVLIGGPSLWLYVERNIYQGGGANFALGFCFLVMPVAVPLALILGLALAAESGKATARRE
jgi:hypothetical protein